MTSVSREFYEKLYGQQVYRNPALVIYDQLRVETIQALIPPHPRGRSLIVGCGSNLDLTLSSKLPDVQVFDLSLNAILSRKSANIQGFVADAQTIPLVSSSYDLIICSEVLEHIPDIKRVVHEFFRLLKPNGVLIVSSPNWLSLFGFTRWAAEKLTSRKFHSSDQPYDDWKTISKFRDELSPYFTIDGRRGVWYLPPLHYKRYGVPKWLMNILFWVYRPVEKLFSKIFPAYGHILVLKASPNNMLIQ